MLRFDIVSSKVKKLSSFLKAFSEAARAAALEARRAKAKGKGDKAPTDKPASFEAAEKGFVDEFNGFNKEIDAFNETVGGDEDKMIMVDSENIHDTNYSTASFGPTTSPEMKQKVIDKMESMASKWTPPEGKGMVESRWLDKEKTTWAVGYTNL